MTKATPTTHRWCEQLALSIRVTPAGNETCSNSPGRELFLEPTSYHHLTHSEETNVRERRDSTDDVVMNVTMPTVGWNKQFGENNVTVDLGRTLSNSFTLDTSEFTTPHSPHSSHTSPNSRPVVEIPLLVSRRYECDISHLPGRQ